MPVSMPETLYDTDVLAWGEREADLLARLPPHPSEHAP